MRIFKQRRHYATVDSDSLAEVVIGAAYEVSNILGAGFLEKLYERALMTELGARGIGVRTQVNYPVYYKGTLVGEYVPDLVVENKVVVELKSCGAAWFLTIRDSRPFAFIREPKPGGAVEAVTCPPPPSAAARRQSSEGK